MAPEEEKTRGLPSRGRKGHAEKERGYNLKSAGSSLELEKAKAGPALYPPEGAPLADTWVLSP